jgi:hypothetical protein
MIMPGVTASGYSASVALQAARFDASGDFYSRSATGLGGQPFTVCCWVKLAVDRNAFGMVIGMDNGSTYNSFGVNATGTRLGSISTAGDQFTSGYDLVVGTWTFIANVHTSSGSATNLHYWQTEGQSTLNTLVSPFSVSTNPLDAWTFYIAKDGFNSWVNASVAQVRVWTASLSAVELLAEYHATTPARTSNLWAAYSFAAGLQTTDDSGNGRTLTAAGTLTTDTSGPTIT